MSNPDPKPAPAPKLGQRKHPWRALDVGWLARNERHNAVPHHTFCVIAPRGRPR